LPASKRATAGAPLTFKLPDVAIDADRQSNASGSTGVLVDNGVFRSAHSLGAFRKMSEFTTKEPQEAIHYRRLAKSIVTSNQHTVRIQIHAKCLGGTAKCLQLDPKKAR
jgi:hypothetical protein